MQSLDHIFNIKQTFKYMHHMWFQIMNMYHIRFHTHSKIDNIKIIRKKQNNATIIIIFNSTVKYYCVPF